MSARRVLGKLLVPPTIAVLFLLPLTLLKREPQVRAAEDVATRPEPSTCLDAARLASAGTLSALETYWPDDQAGPGRPPVSDKINGGDVLYYEYGFERLFARELTSADGETTVYLEEYVMSDAQAAFGVWSANRGTSDEPYEAAVTAVGSEDRAVLWRGARFAVLAADYAEDPGLLPRLVDALAEALAVAEPEAAAPQFPLAKLSPIAGSELLVCGPVTAQDLPLSLDLVGASREQPAWAFRLPLDGGFLPCAALRYGEARWSALARELGCDPEAPELLGGASDARLCAHRRGAWIVVCFMIATEQELAAFREALQG